RKLIILAFSVTLLISFLPYTTGVLNGYNLAGYFIDNRKTALQKFHVDRLAAQHMDWMSVPGAPRFNHISAAPFHVVQLLNPTDWWKKLGLSRFDIDKIRHPPFGVANRFDLASLDGLYRKLEKSEQKKSWHHWVYASPRSFHMEGSFFDEWDKAFYRLIQYHNANPSVASAGFHWISCPHSFLCKAWMVEGPAFLHFTTEELSKDIHRAQKFIVPGYEEVTVQIIEFPIGQPQELAQPRGTFPSPFNQLVGITGNTSIWETRRPHSRYVQINRRFGSLFDKLMLDHPKTYGLVHRLEQKQVRMLGLTDSLWRTIA
ncbi:hypothetical protein B0T10DRAFT_377751, partial [Thelonectria olida]